MQYKCAVCGKWTHHVKGRHKQMKTQEEVSFYNEHFTTTTISLNDYLCGVCRLQPYRAKSSTQTSSSSQESVAQSEENFSDVESVGTDAGLVEINVPHVTSSHKGCFV